MVHPEIERLTSNRSLATNVAERPHRINCNSLRGRGAQRPFSADCLNGNWVEQRVYEEQEGNQNCNYAQSAAILRRQNWRTSYDEDFQTPASSGLRHSFSYTKKATGSVGVSKFSGTMRTMKDIEDQYKTTNGIYGGWEETAMQ